MPILATQTQQDIDRLRRAVKTSYERDLVETVIALRGKHIQTFDLVQRLAGQALEEIRGK